MRVCTRCGKLATAQQRYCTRCVAPLDPPGDGPEALETGPPPAHPGVVSRPSAGRREIVLPEVTRRGWGPRLLRAGDYSDLFLGDEAETGVLPLVIDDPLPDAEGWDADPEDDRLLFPSRDPRHARDGRRRLASAILGAVLMLTGFLTAWAVSRSGLPGSVARLSSSRAPAAAGPASPGATSSPGAPAAVTPAPGVGQNPAAVPVHSLLVRYFTAINQHRFAPYAQSFQPAIRRQLSAAGFAAAYGSTTDTAITAAAITAAQQGPAVTVTFTSARRPAAGTPACTRWYVTLFLVRQGASYLIGAPPPGYHAYHHACG